MWTGRGRAVHRYPDEHDVAIIDKRPEAFDAYLPASTPGRSWASGSIARLLEDAGIKDADAFVAVSNGDNSNIVSARVAREHYHVPKVIARIYDPRRAEIYERLNIPTIATSRWAVKQIQLTCCSTTARRSARPLAAAAPPPAPVPITAHLAGKPVSSLDVDGKVRVGGDLPRRRRLHPDGDLHLPGTATT